MSNKKNKKVEETKMGCPEYMATYGDLVTLLLCFFVILFSMSSVDIQKFEQLVKSLNGGAGILNSQGQNIDTPKKPEDKNSEAFESLEENLNKYLLENNLQENVSVVNEPYGIVLRFKDNILFDSGSATLKEKSLDTLMYVGLLLNKDDIKDKSIAVEGHTDNDPILRNTRYPSNWELSTARASNVVRFLVENASVDTIRISASGYSEYHPIAPNDTAENKSKNRRVDVVILKKPIGNVDRWSDVQ